MFHIFLEMILTKIVQVHKKSFFELDLISLSVNEDKINSKEEELNCSETQEQHF